MTKSVKPKAQKHSEHKAKDTEDKKVYRVYCDGIYDLFHFGHAKSLEQAKKLFPRVHLLVGVCRDEDTEKFKGKPVMTLAERAESVRHCKWVDQVIEGAPWFITEQFLEDWQIDYVAHDAEPYASAGHEDVYALVKRLHKFIPTQRTPAISTSELITRVIRQYHAFVRRNLDRGISPRELNISVLTEGEIWLERFAARFLRGFCRETIDQVKGKIWIVIIGNWKESTEEFLQVIKKKRKTIGQ